VYDVVADHSFRLIVSFIRKTPRPLKYLINKKEQHHARHETAHPMRTEFQ
jgi:lactate dehydrogenase-like 2-hydroxyacid dehydrogenase